MAMQLSSAFARALLCAPAWAPAPAAAAAMAAVLSRRLFSNAARASALFDKRVDEPLQIYKGKTPAPADLTGAPRPSEAAKSTFVGDPFVGEPFAGESFVGETFAGESFVGEPFAGELFDTESYEADGSVEGYSFSGGKYKGDSHSGDIYNTPWAGREARRGD